MDKTAYKVITDGVFKVLKDKNFKIEKFEKGEYFTDGSKAFIIDYDDEKKLIILKTALLQEGEGVDWSVLSSWLMDENAEDRDKISIKNDFCDAVLETLGIKASVGGMKKVEMPSKKKKADSIDMESFSARFLAICPDCKEAYKENVLKYGEFLYDDYFRKYGVEEMKKLANEGNNRKVSKYFELLNSAYVNGENNVAATVVYSILCEAVYTEPSLEKVIDLQLEKFPYLRTAMFNARKILKSESAREKYGIAK